MEFRAESGFVSPYFITDPTRAISQMVEPAVLVHAGEMTLELLALGIGALALRQGKPDVSSKDRPPQTIGFDAAQQALAQIIEKGVPDKPLVLPRPLLVLSLNLDKAALAPLLIAKLRGYLQTLAVCLSSDDVAAVHTSFSECACAQSAVGEVTVLAGLPKLHVVSGTALTVFSTDADCDGILRKYPQIASDKPLSEQAYLFPA